MKNEANAAVAQWGAHYGNAAVLVANHFLLILFFSLLALACGKSNFRRSAYICLVAIVGLNVWSTIGWNMLRVCAAFAER